ncbi:MAG: hypothetical protein K8U03_18205 [Planctomycetia bacterium]|nr:hypothetical protein [Planctomycetia bacterium]
MPRGMGRCRESTAPLPRLRTGRRSLENYLHPEAIREARGLNIIYSATEDVAERAARAAYPPSEPVFAWEALSRRARRRHRDRTKAWLNTDAVERMTVAGLAEQDPAGDVVAWLTAIGDLLSVSTASTAGCRAVE